MNEEKAQKSSDKNSASSKKHPPPPKKSRVAVSLDDFTLEEKPVALCVCIVIDKKKATFSDSWFIEKVEDMETAIDFNKKEQLKSMNGLNAFRKALNLVAFQENPSNGKTTSRINAYTLDVVVFAKPLSTKEKNKNRGDADDSQLASNNNGTRSADQPKVADLTDRETELEIEILRPV